MENIILNREVDVIDALANSQACLVSTDTVFGLCALANTKGEKKIFELKKRDLNKRLPFFVYKMEQVEKYAKNIPTYVYNLATKYWPGALTIVLNASDYSIDRQLCGIDKTIALRMPADNFCLSFLNMLKSDIVCTSANISGRTAPAKVSDIDDSFLELAHEELYDCKLGMPSTVLDCTGSEAIVIRQGAIKL